MNQHFPTWRGQPIPLTREAIETEIERLIDLLDVVDGDADLEPNLGTPESAFALADYWAIQHKQNVGCLPLSSQDQWADGQGDDIETVNEDGGDILDEPHLGEPEWREET